MQGEEAPPAEDVGKEGVNMKVLCISCWHWFFSALVSLSRGPVNVDNIVTLCIFVDVNIHILGNLSLGWSCRTLYMILLRKWGSGSLIVSPLKLLPYLMKNFASLTKSPQSLGFSTHCLKMPVEQESAGRNLFLVILFPFQTNLERMPDCLK